MTCVGRRIPSRSAWGSRSSRCAVASVPDCSLRNPSATRSHICPLASGPVSQLCPRSRDCPAPSQARPDRGTVLPDPGRCRSCAARNTRLIVNLETLAGAPGIVSWDGVLPPRGVDRDHQVAAELRGVEPHLPTSRPTPADGHHQTHDIYYIETKGGVGGRQTLALWTKHSSTLEHHSQVGRILCGGRQEEGTIVAKTGRRSATVFAACIAL
jgi:hypothetical protein